MGMARTTPVASDSVATRGYKRSMTKMVRGMPSCTDDADIDFNGWMRVHHLAANEMAEVEIAEGKDPESKAVVRKVIEDQRREVARIDAWLKQRRR